MKSSVKNIKLNSVDDLFSTEESRQDANREKVMEIPLVELYPFKHHPFKVVDDERMLDTADSIREYGVLVPAIARPREEGGYELVAGHRRKRGCELAGLKTMPVIVRNLDDDAATIIMVDSNIQRESLLPSERAFAYRMKLEALKRQAGRPSKENCDQLGHNSKDERGTVICREYTDENGKTDSIPVTPGRYTFREVYAPEGFALNEAVMTFTVEQDGTVTGDTTIRDDYSRFAIEKHDEASHPLAGVTFSLVNESGNTVMAAVTDANGLAVFEKVPFGTYRVVETAPLSGYTASAMDVSITVDGTFVNPKQPIATVVNHSNEVYLKKVDQDGKPLAGAVFGLYSAFDGCIQQATSDEDGVVKFTRIPYGEYVIKELKAPNGYLPSQTEIPLVIGADFKPDNQPIATVINHRKDIPCIKVDTTGKPLAGVTFSLIHAVTHEVAETVVSDAQGKFHFTQFDYGKWLIREVEAPEGYSKMADIELTVDENWTAPEIIRCVNIPNKFWFFKSDNHKNALSGVTFALEDDRGNFLRELVSGEDGVVHVEDLAPGSYVIRELEPPDGYARTDETIEFTIDETYQVPAKLKRLVNYPSISTGVDFTATPLTWAGIALVGIAGLVIVLEKLRKSGKRSRR